MTLLALLGNSKWWLISEPLIFDGCQFESDRASVVVAQVFWATTTSVGYGAVCEMIRAAYRTRIELFDKADQSLAGQSLQICKDFWAGFAGGEDSARSCQNIENKPIEIVGIFDVVFNRFDLFT